MSSSAVWNGIHFDTKTVIPAWVIGVYVLIIVALLLYGWRKHLLSSYKTVDYVYMGLLAALLVIWNFFISPLIPKFSAVTSWFYYPDIGEIIILLLAASLIGKPGTVMTTMFIYTLLSDIFHYGFGGEPFWFIYELIAYAAMLDLYLLLRGKYFGTNNQVVGRKKVQGEGGTVEVQEKVVRIPGLFVIDSVIGGVVVALAYPLFYHGFFATFVEGYSYTTQYVLTNSLVSAAGGVIMGLIAAPFVVYIRKVITGVY
ncbi:MAG: hypothetical protein RXR41_06425 [Candidatus Marsarchaeota archaeon]